MAADNGVSDIRRALENLEHPSQTRHDQCVGVGELYEVWRVGPGGERVRILLTEDTHLAQYLAATSPRAVSALLKEVDQARAARTETRTLRAWLEAVLVEFGLPKPA